MQLLTCKYLLFWGIEKSFRFFGLLDAQPPKYRQDGTDSPEKNQGKTGAILFEDYAEIVDEEGDYSTPAGKYSGMDIGVGHCFPQNVFFLYILHFFS